MMIFTTALKWADDYFFIKHRDETRGIGGIFYDRFNRHRRMKLGDVFEFSKALGRSFIPTYTELVNRSRDKELPTSSSNGNTSAAAVTPNLTWYMMPAPNSGWKLTAVSNRY
jgi:coproporphyrinogen III oxidase